MLMSFFQRVCLGTQVRELSVDFDISAAAVGALAGSYFYMYLVLQLPFGLAFDYFSRMDGVMGACAFLLAGGAVLFAEARTVGAAFAGRQARFAADPRAGLGPRYVGRRLRNTDHEKRPGDAGYRSARDIVAGSVQDYRRTHGRHSPTVQETLPIPT